MSRSDDDATLDELGALLREQEHGEAMGNDVDLGPFAPLSDEEQAMLTAGVLDRLGVPTSATTPAPAQQAKVVRLPARTSRWPVIATVLSVAAAALLAFWPRSERDELPAYALVIPPADASHRAANDLPASPSAGDALSRYTLGRELEVLLRPDTRVTQRIAAHAYVEQPGGTLRQLSVAPAAMDGGVVAFRIRTGPGSELARPGPTRLHFIVAGAGTLPAHVTTQSELPAHAQRLLFALELTDEHTPGAPAPPAAEP